MQHKRHRYTWFTPYKGYVHQIRYSLYYKTNEGEVQSAAPCCKLFYVVNRPLQVYLHSIQTSTEHKSWKVHNLMYIIFGFALEGSTNQLPYERNKSSYMNITLTTGLWHQCSKNKPAHWPPVYHINAVKNKPRRVSSRDSKTMKSIPMTMALSTGRRTHEHSLWGTRTIHRLKNQDELG